MSMMSGRIYKFSHPKYGTITGVVINSDEKLLEIEIVGNKNLSSEDISSSWVTIAKIGERLFIRRAEVTKFEELKQGNKVRGKDSCKYFGKLIIKEAEVDCENCSDMGECSDKAFNEE